MKQVKVYTLKEDDLIITNGVDSISFYSDKNLRPVLSTSPTEFYDSYVSATQSPIKRVIIDGKDYYYSFDPKLEEVMKAYYGVYSLQASVEELKVKSKKLSDELRSTQDRELELKDTLLTANLKLIQYKNISLWKRIVFLFTGRV